MADDRIEVLDGNGTMTAHYRVSLNEEGRCALLGADGEIVQWRARREALEGLFFSS